MQDNSKYPRIKKIHQKIEKITRIDQKDQNQLCLVISVVSCYHMNCGLQKYITHQFTYFNYYLNPTSTSRDTCKTIFIILFVFYWRLI